jgi:hypothetical protein
VTSVAAACQIMLRGWRKGIGSIGRLLSAHSMANVLNVQLSVCPYVFCTVASASPSVRRLPVIGFCIKSAVLFTLYLFVSAELAKREVSKKRPMCIMCRITVTIQAH